MYTHTHTGQGALQSQDQHIPCSFRCERLQPVH